MDLELMASDPSMDPRLLRLLERQGQGRFTAPSSSTNAGEVAVVARVDDVAAWEALSEVRPGATLGPARSDDGFIVTGRVPVDRLGHVRSRTLSLKAAQAVRPTLAATVSEIRARPADVPAGSAGGAGVVVGIVDFGGDVVHRNFRRPDGRTRLLALWDQGGVASPTSPFGYGRVFGTDQIDAALTAADPYRALGYDVATDTARMKGTHGTHVMDIAAGNGGGSGVAGVAPQADLVFVELTANDVPSAGPDVVGGAIGDSVHLLEAVKFVFDVAGDRPCVVNLSLGTNGGPHDGTTLVEQGLDALVGDAPNRAVVIAASNAHEHGIHCAGTVTTGRPVDVGWVVGPGDVTHNELEIWYPGSDELRVDVISPDGSSVGSLALGESGRMTSGGRTVLFAVHRAADPNNGDNVFMLFLEADNSLPTGTWTIRLRGVSVTDGSFHGWIERDDNGQSSFTAPHDNTHTLGSLSCGHATIAVGSYDAHKAARPVSFFSSAGPTRDGRPKPEVSAPGHDVVAAHSRTGVGVTTKSGTSMAAPAVTGLVALVLAQAAAKGRSLGGGELRDLVVGSARRDPPTGAGWHDRYGGGRVDAVRAIDGVA